MRGYDCFYYHYENKELVKNSATACWAGLSNQFRKKEKGTSNTLQIVLDEKTKNFIYISDFNFDELEDNDRKRMVYLVNKINHCKFVKIKGIVYIEYALLKNHYQNLLLLNFIRCLWYKAGSFDNENFFIDICKRKPKNLDYLEFMMTCIKKNVSKSNTWSYGDHNFVYADIIPKRKELFLQYTGMSMMEFLQSKI